jgi:hypothetical protein
VNIPAIVYVAEGVNDGETATVYDDPVGTYSPDKVRKYSVSWKLLMTTAFVLATDREKVMLLHPRMYPTVGGAGGPPTTAGVIAGNALVIPEMVVYTANWYRRPSACDW